MLTRDKHELSKLTKADILEMYTRAIDRENIAEAAYRDLKNRYIKVSKTSEDLQEALQLIEEVLVTCLKNHDLEYEFEACETECDVIVLLIDKLVFTREERDGLVRSVSRNRKTRSHLVEDVRKRVRDGKLAKKQDL